MSKLNALLEAVEAEGSIPEPKVTRASNLELLHLIQRVRSLCPVHLGSGKRVAVSYSRSMAMGGASK